MIQLFKDLDRLLRGEATQLDALRQGRIEVPASGMTMLVIVLGAIYGVCMGCFALFREEGPSYVQLLASAMKVPLLFLLTLVVTMPSLYVFNALVGSRLSLVPVLRLLIASLAVMLAVLASLGPIVAFFSLSTTSYPFMKLLNVIAFAVAGFLGLGFLLQTLHRLTIVESGELPAPAEEPEADIAANETDDTVADEPSPRTRSALDRMDRLPNREVKMIFRIWVIVFGLVGAQMAWILRPFIGHPGMPFAWFRPRGQSNFFESVWDAIEKLF